jgi:hypothetical protein
MRVARCTELPPTVATTHPDYARERYSVATAALYLTVPRSAIYRAAAAGRIGHRVISEGQQLHHIRLFSQKDLDQYRDKQPRVEATDAPPVRPAAIARPVKRPTGLPMPEERQFT